MLHFLFLCAFAFAATEDQWPEFLGRNATPIFEDAVPLEWGPGTNIAWKVQLPGKGQSSPIVWNNTIYVTSIAGSMKETCQVNAIDIKSGTIRWTKEFSSPQTTRSNYFQSRSAPTPIADSAGLYAFFETGIFVALDHDGNERWQRALTEDYGPFESTIGLASSPTGFDEKVVLLIDHEGPSYLLALDKKSGETVWKTDRDSRVSYSSPSIVSVNGNANVVCSSNGSVDGYDPNTGELLWTNTEIGANSQNTPLTLGEAKILVGASPGMHAERESIARESNLCLEISKVADRYETKVLWRASGVMSTFASPMHHQGYTYWITKAGIVHCFDAANGELKYKERIAGESWATPIGIGNRIHFFGKDGKTTVLQSGPEFRKLAENELWDSSLTPPTRPGSRGGRSTHQHSASDESEKGNIAESGGSKPSDATERGETTREPRRSGPPRNAEETEAARAEGENRFADPVQYGVAATSQGFIIRTGEHVYCVRKEAKQ